MCYCQVFHKCSQLRRDCELSCLCWIHGHWHHQWCNFATIIDHRIRVDMMTDVQTACLTTMQPKLAIDSDKLKQWWGIPLHKAKRTVQFTTQHGMRNNANLILLPRFCTNDCMFRYFCLHHTIFTDTMFVSTQSQFANKCAQIFSSNFGWPRTYPMKLKGEAYDALSLLLQCEGVPPLMVMDCSKEQSLGKFR